MIKKLFPVLLVTTAAILLTACSTTQFNYSSSAHIPHYTSSTETIMNVMLTDGNNSRSYGVLTATDNQEIDYLLIAPKTGGQRSSRSQITDFNINEATYIDLEAAEEFQEALTRIVGEWDKLRQEDGFFYEFGSAPEINVTQLDEQNIQFIPSVRFYFNITDEGATGEMILEYHNSRSDYTTIRTVEMNRKNNVEELLELITMGVEYFD